MWWSVVTFTTVGYGDFFPVTSTGRIAGVLLMLGGIALIGTLAGSLGSFFSSGGDESDSASTTAAPDGDDDGEVLTEMRALRLEIADLRRRMTTEHDDPMAR